MTKKQILKKICLATLVVVIFIAVGLYLNDVVRQKWSYEGDNAAQQIVTGYYNEAPHTIDVLMLGASTIRNGFSPLEMYKDYGFTTYSRATSIQTPVISYYLLQETLESQDLKAVVIDATLLSNMMYETEENMVGKMHEAIDYMPYSTYKRELVRVLAENNEDVSQLEFWVPLYAYHDRWSQLTEQDFTYHSWDDTYYYKGQYPTLKTTNTAYPEGFMEDDPRVVDKDFYLHDESLYYFEKIVSLCREQGIELVLVKAPAASWSNYRHSVIQKYADENDIEFIDFCLPERQSLVDFDVTSDFSDAGKHPNITGAQKLSQYLGNYLVSVCDFTDKRNDPAYASWDMAVGKYDCLLEDAALSRESNLVTFLEQLDNDRFITMIATRNDVSTYFNNDLATAFSNIGITTDFAANKYLSYVALLRGGELIYDTYNLDGVVSYSTDYDGHSISIESSANQLVGNSVSFVFDGEKLTSPNNYGFNFVVFDTETQQIVATKSFNSGLNGRDYTKDSVFKEYMDDPIGYLSTVTDDDYITVMSVSGDGSKYMPGVVNDKLTEMGLIPLDGEFDRPYIAVLNGSEVVYNEYGIPGTELSMTGEVEGVPITVVDNMTAAEGHLYAAVGSEEFRKNSSYSGLSIYVYSKSYERVFSQVRFDWLNNYTSEMKLSSITSIAELLTEVRRGEYDLFCLNVPVEMGGATEDVFEALRDFGFTMLEAGEYYAGWYQNDGQHDQESSGEGVELDFVRDGASIQLNASAESFGASFDELFYACPQDGLYLMVYDPENRAVLSQTLFEADAYIGPFGEIGSDPIAYLEALRDDEFISVISVTGEGSKYMPGVVNDKLEEMGLLPMDGDFDRPYVAILDGAEVVLNQYGASGGEIVAIQQVGGVPVAVADNMDPDTGYLAVSIGNQDFRKTNSYSGLSVYVYSRAVQRVVSQIRFDWTNNYLSPAKVSAVSNTTELMTAAKIGEYDLICLYARDKVNATPTAMLEQVRDCGFTELGSTDFYVGVIRGDGQVQQLAGVESAALELDQNGVLIQASAAPDELGAVFDGLRYDCPKAGLYVMAYDPAVRAVLSQVSLEEAYIDPLEDITDDPVAYLDLLGNDDYITVMCVSSDGSKFIPGVVNDKLESMGLLPLDGAFGCPYVALLDGANVVYNEYDDPGTEISVSREIAGVPIAVVNDASEDEDGHLYVSIGNEEYRKGGNNPGLSVYVYSKTIGRVVSLVRYDWSRNYLNETTFRGVTDIIEFLTRVNRGEFDLFCLYAGGEDETVSAEVLEALHIYGFSELGAEDFYAGAVRSGGAAEQTGDASEASVSYDWNGVSVRMKAADEGSEAVFDGVTYDCPQHGLYLFAYDAENRGVLSQTFFQIEASQNLFPAYYEDPIGFFDLLSDDNYISVLSVTGEGSKYMPGVVNDKLAEIGLIPMDGAFDRPYIAVLNGSEVVYNEYGEAGGEISMTDEIEGVRVTVTDSEDAEDGYLAVTIGEQEFNKNNSYSGLSVYVYDKTEEKVVSNYRFDWSQNYLSETRLNDITNIVEMLATLKHGNFDTYCLYSPAESDGISDAKLQELRGLGFSELDAGAYYAGAVMSDGSQAQAADGTSAELSFERNGVGVQLTASADRSAAAFDGLSYDSPQQPGLYLVVYDSAHRAVMSARMW